MGNIHHDKFTCASNLILFYSLVFLVFTNFFLLIPLACLSLIYFIRL